MTESHYVRTGRADLIARLEAVDIAIARIQDRLATCRRNQAAARDEILAASARAREETYEIVLAEFGASDSPVLCVRVTPFVCGHPVPETSYPVPETSLPCCPQCGEVRVREIHPAETR